MTNKMSYDKEFDILAAHKGFRRGERFKGNIEIGDLILDISSKMRVVGMEIMNASKYLKGFLEPIGTKRVLENLKDVRFTTMMKGESLTLSVTMISTIGNKDKRIPAMIAVPMERPIQSS